MLNADWIILFFIIPLIGSFSVLIEKIFPKLNIVKPAAVISLSACLILAGAFLKGIINGRYYETSVGNWPLVVGIGQMLDGTAWLGITVMFTVSLLAMIFAFAEKQYDSKFYFFFLVLTAGLAGILLSSDLFNLFVCFELVGICAYILIAYLQKDRAILASFKYLFLSSAGISLFLTGVFILYKNTGSLYINEIALYFHENKLSNPEAVFAVSAIITGIGIKTSFIPFHTWLPDAHAYAPHPVSAVLSGVVIKVSFLAVWRLVLIFNLKDVQTYLLWAGTATAVYGTLRALMQSDCKVLLAWSSVSQIGFIIAGFGAGTALSLTGSLYHIMSHAFFKSLLFLVIGSVIIITGERSLKKLSGLGRAMPYAAILFLAGALSISGIPPFNGYVSKKLILAGLSDTPLAYWALWAASAGTIAYFIKLSRIFWGNSRDFQFYRQKTVVRFNYKSGYSVIAVLALLSLITGISGSIIMEFFSCLITGTQYSISYPLWNISSITDSLSVIIPGILCYMAVMSRLGLKFQKLTESIKISLDWSLIFIFAGFLSAAGFLTAAAVFF